MIQKIKENFKKILNVNVFVITAFLISTTAFAQVGHSPSGGHLSFKNNTLHIHATFLQEPVVGSEATLVLEAKNPTTHQAIELNDQIEVTLWMPSMGHGSSPTKIERTVDSSGNRIPGTFNVRNAYFIMGGDWDVRVTLTDENGIKEMKSFAVTIAGGHHH